ncbi:hypothetical protein LIER_25077 [Lithospermum erythrorhizon]|uniref:Uncharacterized protein n=1 Tax=Lithospermum erythrorhizon TaxID=34254 RepID=A0AAV3R9B1_LITER
MFGHSTVKCMARMKYQPVVKETNVGSTSRTKDYHDKIEEDMMVVKSSAVIEIPNLGVQLGDGKSKVEEKKAVEIVKNDMMVGKTLNGRSGWLANCTRQEEC